MTTQNSGATVYLDNYSGSDDAKLTAALSATSHFTTNAILVLPSRPLVFSARGRVPQDQLSIQGCSRAGEITLNFDSQDGVGWFHGGTSLSQQCHFENLSFRSNSGSSGAHPAFLTQSGASPGFQQLVLHSIQSSGLWGVVGVAAQRVLLTACTFSGPDWDINNGWNTAFYMGGSDNVFFTDGLLLDSPGTPDGNDHCLPGGVTPHMRIGYMDKSRFGRIYTTATGHWSALLYEGYAYNSGNSGGNAGPCTFDCCVFEGRNKSRPCYDSVVSVTGGQPIFRDCWFGYALSVGNVGNGIVNCTAGYTRIEDPTYGNATGVAEAVPFLWASGAATHARLFNGTVGSQAGAWSDPRPRWTAASSASVAADSSFIQV